MRIYIIEHPFMARAGQFEDRPVLVCGIEVNTLRQAGEYRIYIGKNRKMYYDITYREALEIYGKFGDNCLKMRGNKKVFILPFKYMRFGVTKDYDKEIEKRNKLEIQQTLL